MRAVLENYETAPISDAEKSLLKFVSKVNRRPEGLDLADVEEAKSAGWSDEALYDAISVCALFNFYNRWVAGNGVQDMTAYGYKMSGRRIATEGYVHEAPK